MPIIQMSCSRPMDQARASTPARSRSGPARRRSGPLHPPHPRRSADAARTASKTSGAIAIETPTAIATPTTRAVPCSIRRRTFAPSRPAPTMMPIAEEIRPRGGAGSCAGVRHPQAWTDEHQAIQATAGEEQEDADDDAGCPGIEPAKAPVAQVPASHHVVHRRRISLHGRMK